MAEVELEYVIRLVDEFSETAEQVEDRAKTLIDTMQQTGASAGSAGGGFTRASTGARDFGESTGFSMMNLVGLLYTVNTGIRILSRFESRQYALQNAQDALKKAEEERDNVLKKYIGTQGQATEGLTYYTGEIERAAIASLVRQNVQLTNVNIMREEAKIMGELRDANVNVETAERRLAHMQFQENLGIAQLIAFSGIAGGQLIAKYIPAILSSARSLLTFGEATALSASETAAATEVIGPLTSTLAEGTAASGGLAVTLGQLGIVTVPLVVSGRGLITTMTELSNQFQSGSIDGQQFNSTMMTMTNPVLLLGQGIQSFMKDLQLIPEQTPSISESITAMTSGISSAISSIPSTVSISILGSASGLISAAASALAAITGIPQDHSTAIEGESSGAVSAAQEAISALMSIPQQIMVTIQAVWQGLGDWASGTFGGRAAGLSYAPKAGHAFIGEGEAILTKAENRARSQPVQISRQPIRVENLISVELDGQVIMRKFEQRLLEERLNSAVYK